MSKHEDTATEQLSAYLDGELSPDETEALEARLKRERHTRERLEGLRRVVQGLRQSEPPPVPPPTLHHAVARRIALERDRTSYLDRLEQSLSPLRRYNPVLPMFAVVIALCLAVYFLSILFARAEQGDTELIVVGADSEGPGGHLVGSRLEVAGRVLFWDGTQWRERDTAEEPAREIDTATAEGRTWLDAHPELLALGELDARVILLVEGETVRIRPPP